MVAMFAGCYQNLLSIHELIHADTAAVVEHKSTTLTRTIISIAPLIINTFSPAHIEYIPSHL